MSSKFLGASAATNLADGGQLLEVGKFFSSTCVESCDVLNAHANAGGANNGRTYQLKPDKDSKQYKIMNAFWARVGNG